VRSPAATVGLLLGAYDDPPLDALWELYSLSWLAGIRAVFVVGSILTRRGGGNDGGKAASSGNPSSWLHQRFTRKPLPADTLAALYAGPPPLPRGLFCSLESCLQGRPGPHQYRGTSWALCRWSPLSFLSAAVPCPWPLECTPGGHESLRASSGQLNPTSAINYPPTRGAGDERRLPTFFLSFFSSEVGYISPAFDLRP